MHHRGLKGGATTKSATFITGICAPEVYQPRFVHLEPVPILRVTGPRTVGSSVIRKLGI